MKNNFFNKLKTLYNRFEAKYEKYALDGLMYYIAGLMLVVFILHSMGFLSYGLLRLDRAYLMKWQLWRLITFLLIPVSNHPFFLFFELGIIIMCANGIEAAMGSFKLTLYYLLGAFFMIIAVLIDPSIQHSSYAMYLCLFWAYATLCPNDELLFMFIIPVKIKYLAILSSIGIFISFIFASWQTKIALLLSFANYLIFFAIPAYMEIKHERQQSKRRAEFEKVASPQKEYRHKCSICGKTDVTNPDELFKYCICKECGENGVCFCSEHLKEHKNKTNK